MYHVAIDVDYKIYFLLVDGNWGPWEPLSECNKTCGYGYQRRVRPCNNPVPKGSGLPCQGVSVNIVPGCNAIPCPGE